MRLNGGEGNNVANWPADLPIKKRPLALAPFSHEEPQEKIGDDVDTAAEESAKSMVQIRRHLDQIDWPIDLGLFIDTSNETISGRDVSSGASPVVLGQGRKPLVKKVDQELETILEDAADLEFEDGVESDLAVNVGQFIKKHETAAVEALERFYEADNLKSDIAGEVLRAVGRIDDPNTDTERLNLLLKCLGDPSPAVRHSAVMGLSYFEGNRVHKRLRARLQIEKNSIILRSMKRLLSRRSA
jgi:hypothetical protein